MFKVKVYRNTKMAMNDAKAWLKRTFPHGRVSLEAGDEECGNEDFGPTDDAVCWIDDYFPELDRRQGHLIVHALDFEAYAHGKDQIDKGIKTFKFFEAPTEEELAFYEECARKESIFQEAGGERELFIKDKADYLKKHSPFKGKANLEARMKCIHCESVFQIKDYKVIAGVDIDYIVCPHYPYCDGNITDWMPTKKPVKVSKHIITAQKRKNEPVEENPEPQRSIKEAMMEYKLAECELPAGEGLAVFYNENPKEGDFVLVAVKRSMYEKMKVHLKEVLQPNQWYDGNHDRICMVQPAVFIIDSPESE